MSRFTQYYIRYKHDIDPYDWDNRQQHLDSLFERDDSIEFFLGEGNERKVYRICGTGTLIYVILMEKINGTQWIASCAVDDKPRLLAVKVRRSVGVPSTTMAEGKVVDIIETQQGWHRDRSMTSFARTGEIGATNSETRIKTTTE